jgi:hypothetical protein
MTMVSEWVEEVGELGLHFEGKAGAGGSRGESGPGSGLCGAVEALKTSRT